MASFVELMRDLAPQFVPITAEVWLLCVACAMLLIDSVSFTKTETAAAAMRSSNRSLWIAQIGICVAAAIALCYTMGGQTQYAWNGMLVSDPLANFLKAGCAIATLLTLAYGTQYAMARGMHKVELYTLAIFSLMGQMIMVSSNNLLTMYLGLELMSLSLYALVALRRDHTQSTEAAMKYFVLGALASGFMLYGMSMLYGATGSLDTSTIFKALSEQKMATPMATFGVAAATTAVTATVSKAAVVLASVFIVAGLAFKLGAAPFHMWIPDVYDGAPTTVTLLIAGAPKLAALGLTLRLLVETMLPLAIDWQPMLLVLGIASVALGNVVAVMQTNLKRMLAYSTISHMGFVAMALACGVSLGANNTLNTANAVGAYGIALFYMSTYVLTTLASFAIIMVLSRAGFECDQISNLRGLGKTNPWLALIMLLIMLSLAGIPPMVGFWAKFEVLNALLLQDHTLVAVVAVMFSLVGAFYYLRVLKTMYFEEADTQSANSVPTPWLLSLNAVLIVGLGLFPSGLMQLCRDVIKAALAG